MAYVTELAPYVLAALTIIFTYLTTRSNNSAKLKEIAFQKRLEVYSDMCEHLHLIIRHLGIISGIYRRLSTIDPSDEESALPYLDRLVQEALALRDDYHTLMKINTKYVIYSSRGMINEMGQLFRMLNTITDYDTITNFSRMDTLKADVVTISLQSAKAIEHMQKLAFK